MSNLRRKPILCPKNACQPEYVLDSRAAIGTKSYWADKDKT